MKGNDIVEVLAGLSVLLTLWDGVELVIKKIVDRSKDRCECRKMRKNHYNMKLPGGGRWTASMGGECRKFRLKRKKK